MVGLMTVKSQAGPGLTRSGTYLQSRYYGPTVSRAECWRRRSRGNGRRFSAAKGRRVKKSPIPGHEIMWRIMACLKACVNGFAERERDPGVAWGTMQIGRSGTLPRYLSLKYVGVKYCNVFYIYGILPFACFAYELPTLSSQCSLPFFYLLYLITSNYAWLKRRVAIRRNTPPAAHAHVGL